MDGEIIAMNNWLNPILIPPPSGESVLIRMKNGEVHEGHYIKNANKYVKNVDRFRVYKLGKKTIPLDEVKEWRRMPG